MRRLALMIVALVPLYYSVAIADSPSAASLHDDTSTLLERALQERESDRVATPVGSCVYFCDDQLIEIERCPDGDCPAFECYARTKTCQTKPAP